MTSKNEDLPLAIAITCDNFILETCRNLRRIMEKRLVDGPSSSGWSGGVGENDQEDSNPNPTRKVHWEDPALEQKVEEDPNGNAHGNSKRRSYAGVAGGKTVNETNDKVNGLIQLE